MFHNERLRSWTEALKPFLPLNNENISERMKTIPQRIQTWTRTAGAALMMTLLLCAAPSVKAADKVGDAAYEAAAGLFNLGLWKQASESYKEYFAKHPRHPLVAHGHFGLGLCYFNLKEYASAAKELGLAAKGEGPSKVESNLYLGQALLLKTPMDPKTCLLYTSDAADEP